LMGDLLATPTEFVFIDLGLQTVLPRWGHFYVLYALRYSHCRPALLSLLDYNRYCPAGAILSTYSLLQRTTLFDAPKVRDIELRRSDLLDSDKKLFP